MNDKSTWQSSLCPKSVFHESPLEWNEEKRAASLNVVQRSPRLFLYSEVAAEFIREQCQRRILNGVHCTTPKRKGGSRGEQDVSFGETPPLCILVLQTRKWQGGRAEAVCFCHPSQSRPAVNAPFAWMHRIPIESAEKRVERHSKGIYIHIYPGLQTLTCSRGENMGRKKKKKKKPGDCF